MREKSLAISRSFRKRFQAYFIKWIQIIRIPLIYRGQVCSLAPLSDYLLLHSGFCWTVVNLIWIRNFSNLIAGSLLTATFVNRIKKQEKKGNSFVCDSLLTIFKLTTLTNPSFKSDLWMDFSEKEAFLLYISFWAVIFSRMTTGFLVSTFSVLL